MVGERGEPFASIQPCSCPYAAQPLEGDGFEPSPLCPKSSVSAALAPSVAANLHPYTAPFCTPFGSRFLDEAGNPASLNWPCMIDRAELDTIAGIETHTERK